VGESEHGGCKEPDGFGMLNFLILQFSSSPPQHAFTNKRYVGSNTPIRAKDYVRGENRTDCGWGGSASLDCCFHCSCLQTQVAKMLLLGVFAVSSAISSLGLDSFKQGIYDIS